MRQKIFTCPLLKHEANKKGVSIMIGYVLLIVGIIAMSAIVYVWLKSYVPRDILECPDGVSLFIEESNCENIEGNYSINLSIKNNGRFEIDGYFIKATINPNQTIATKDISRGIISGGHAPQQAGIVLFSGGVLGPENRTEKIEYILEFPIYSIEITPIRYETIEGKNRLISCGNAKIKEKINCSIGII